MQDITRPLRNGYSFNVTNYVKGGWQLMNAQMGTFIGMTILIIFIQLILGLMPVVNLLSNFISPILCAGYFIYCRNILLGKNEAADFFKGFNYVGNILLYVLVYILILMPLIVIFLVYVFPLEPIMELASGSIEPNEFGLVVAEHMINASGGILLMIFLMMIVSIYFSLSYIFVIPLIVDTGLGFWQAMELSRKVVAKKFFNFFISLFIGGVLMGIAILITCGLGSLFVFPIYYCIIFSAYDQIFTPYADELENNMDSSEELQDTDN